MELITSGTKFYLNGMNLYGLKSTPDMGGSREKKQVTNLLDTAHRYIAGLYKYDELTFGFYYNSDSDNPNISSGQVAAAYSAARAIEYDSKTKRNNKIAQRKNRDACRMRLNVAKGIVTKRRGSKENSRDRDDSLAF